MPDEGRREGSADAGLGAGPEGPAAAPGDGAAPEGGAAPRGGIGPIAGAEGAAATAPNGLSDEEAGETGLG